MALLRPEFGPGLPELLAPRTGWPVRRLRVVLIAVAVLLVALQALRVLTSDSSGLVNDVLVREPIAFTLGYRDQLERVEPQGEELLRLQSRPGGKTEERFTVAPLALPAYRGQQGGTLPVAAAREVAALRRTFPDGFRFRGDGRARINLIPGHQVLFQTRIGDRLWYGKRYLLLPDEPGAREGVRITVLSRYSKATPSVDAVGVFGLTKGPLRSFRFGTERP